MRTARIRISPAIVALVAASSFQTARAASPPASLEARADAAFLAKDWPAAAHAYAEMVAAHADSALARYRLGVARLYLGELDAGLAQLDSAEKLGWPVGQTAYRKACAHAAAGRLDRAIAELGRASDAGFAQLALADGDPLLAKLRADTRWPALRERLDRAAHPCKYDPKFRAFDYWVGEWDVRPNGSPGAPPAENVVTLEYGDCVVHEHWKSPNSSGESFNIYDASRGEWFQTWVDDGGGLHQYHGNPDAQGNLDFSTDLQYAPGEPRQATRLRFFRLGPDEVRQLSERSPDGGKSWTVNYDLIYTRRAKAAAAKP